MRWKPTRAGIFNVWEYDDQEFEFGDGRLVLRGRNGSGKSNALALLFPFLFDGVMSAARMDPMGGARSMKSLLLGRDDESGRGQFRHDSGTGYVWMEFIAEQAFLTIGVGASATQQRDANAWFFLTNQRIGHDLQLANNDVPKNRRQLTESLTDGQVYTTAEEFRSAVDQALFALGPARYRTLIDLLLTLRRPHLASKLDTEHLSAALGAGLAELDRSLVEDVAHSFDDLDAMQHEIEGLGEAMGAVDRFLPAYREHLVSIARQRAGRFVETQRQHRRARREHSAALTEQVSASEQLVQHNEQIEEILVQQELLSTEVETIQLSAAYQSATALAEVKLAATRAEQAAASAGTQAKRSATQATEAAESRVLAEQRKNQAEAQLGAAVQDWIATAHSAGIEAPFGAAAFDQDQATALVVDRLREVDSVATAARTSLGAAAESDRASQAQVRHQELLDQALTTHRQALSRITTERASLAAQRLDWSTSADEVLRQVAESGSNTRFASLHAVWDTAPTAGEGKREDAGENVGVDAEASEGETDPDLEAVAKLDSIMAEAETVLALALDGAKNRVENQVDLITGLESERDRVASEPNPGPPPNPTRPDAIRSEDPSEESGAPLYVCVDFAPSVSAADRAGLEAALGASGILDARIAATGGHPNNGDSDLLDAILGSSNLLDGTDSSTLTLADVLQPVSIGELTTERIQQVLAAVPLDGDLVQIGADGRWKLGPLAGRFHQEEPLFIGHEARERRRAERLDLLDSELETERHSLAEFQSSIAGLVVLQTELTASRRQQPAVTGLRNALNSADQARAVALDHSEQLSSATEAARHLLDQAQAASADLHRLATRTQLPNSLEELTGFGKLLDDCRHYQQRVQHQQASLSQAADHLQAQTVTASQTSEFAANDQLAATEAHNAAKNQLLRYERLQSDVGADATQAIEDLAIAKKKRADSEERLASIRGQAGSVQATIARLGERAARLEQDHQRLLKDLQGTEARFAPICSNEVSEVLIIEGLDPSTDPLRAARLVLSDTEKVEEGATNRMELAYRTILLDGLRAGHDPSMPKLDGLDVVRVGTADGEIPIGSLATQLHTDYERMNQLLTDREREIFETHLLTRVGDALRQLLLEADDFEQRINAEMSKAPTASGMTVELKWEVDSSEPGLREAVETLRFAPEMVGPERRELLRSFFTRRIDDLRSSDPGLSFSETLSAALDYRSWHRFTLFARFADGKRQRVTRKFYRGLSGGEAATLLHLPLFAAAAAHYSSGAIRGPRIIALDEAFAGIDDQMRGRLMGLLTQLDLDVILTSHEFWGFYEQVPNLVLYDLTRRPPDPGVFAQRFDWNAS